MTERKRESLLEWAAGQPPAPPDPQELALRASFEHARTKLSGEQEQDGAALLRYFDRLHAAWSASEELKGRAWAKALLGSYFAVGMRKKRSLGRPKSQRVAMFTHVWHELNSKRVAAGLPPFLPAVPAKEIAAEVARKEWGSFTAKQVSDAFGRAPEWRDLVLSANYRGKDGT